MTDRNPWSERFDSRKRTRHAVALIGTPAQFASLLACHRVAVLFLRLGLDLLGNFAGPGGLPAEAEGGAGDAGGFFKVGLFDVVGGAVVVGVHAGEEEDAGD